MNIFNGQEIHSSIQLHLNEGEGITPAGTIDITENGEHDVTPYAFANVHVPDHAAELIAYYNGETNELIIPEGVTALRAYAFVNQYTATKITLPESLLQLGTYSLTGAKLITQIDLKNVEALEYRCLYECIALTDVIMPAALQTMSYKIFDGCSSLKELTFRNKPTSIHSEAFSNSSLEVINCPWAEGEVANAPWGSSATINYNYTEE